MIAQYWQTVRHLRPRQVLARVGLRAAAHARRSWPSGAERLYDGLVLTAGLQWRDHLLGLQSSLASARQAVDAGTRREIAGRVAALMSGRFEFLNESAVVGWPPDWSAPGSSRLWLFHLHYFDDLLDLAFAEDRPMPLTLELIDNWIGANPIHGRGATRDAWHPYVVSLRMVNWMLALSASGGAADVPANVRPSLEKHALFLERNLETDSGGNHLLKNLKALVFAGCFWSGSKADGWRRRYARRFVDELDAQLLGDGGHYERSPMYHCQVMADAIEVAALLASRESGPVVEELVTLVGRMDRFLHAVTHPDGLVALFNDSAHSVGPDPGAMHRAAARLMGTSGTPPTAPRLELLLSTVGRVARAAAPSADPLHGALASGYVVLPSERPDRYLLADVGAPCPDDLPAHAHADLLSFELSVDGRRIVVDSGVGEYTAGPWRDYYRSTRAHNTVMVDGIEQSDCWASFRVGRRASPANVAFRQDAHASMLEAEHTGYDHLPKPVRHRRRFVWSHHGFWIVADSLAGSGEHAWRSFCHFHPDVAVVAQDESWIRVARDEVVLDVCWYGFAGARCVRGEDTELQGWYAAKFGPASPATVLILEGRRKVPASFGYALIPQRSLETSRPVVSMHDDRSIHVRVGEIDYRISDTVSVNN